MPDPLPLQLTRLRDTYILALTRVSTTLVNPFFKMGRVKKLQAMIVELNTQIANNEKGAQT